MNSIASNSPIVREIVFRIISSGEIINTKDKHRIDSNLVPMVSQKTHMHSRGLQESVLKITPQITIEKNFQHAPISNRPTFIPQQNPSVILEGYGRLSSLIRDNSISSIEYTGDGQPIRINRLGKIQNTNIFLSKEEIKSLMEYVSTRTRIPVTNKVFKVAIDNILFNAMVLEDIGTRFLIKKNFQISQDYNEAFR